MKASFWNTRIPTLLGLFILFLGIGSTTLLTNKNTIFQTRATSLEQPQNVRISNISGDSFSVSYYTLEKIPGSLNYGKDNTLGQSAFDQRSQNSDKFANYQIHSIVVNNLSPATKYYFTITSGQNSYYNNGKAFEVITAPSIPNPTSDSESIKGKVSLPSGNPPLEAIVYLTLDNSQVVSALLKSDGSYEIPLATIRSSDLSSYYSFNNDPTIKMLIHGDLLTSNIILSKTSLVPLIILSRDYNFLADTQTTASLSANLTSFPSLESTSSATEKIQILTPKKDQGLTDDQPLFKGTASPGENVQIVIHSDQVIETQVTTDKNGNWSYQPTEPLTPGTHTITITTKSLSGILKTITQSFVVYASGTQIPNASGSPTPTPTPTAILTPTPTDEILPTTTLMPTPTAILTQAPVSTTSSMVLPPTGNPFIIIFGIVGLVISLTGGLLFFISRKSFKL